MSVWMNFGVNVEGERTSVHAFRILERRCIAKMGCIRLSDDFSSRSPARLVYIHTLCRIGHILVRRQGEKDNSVDDELDPAEVASCLRAPPSYVQPQDEGLGMMSNQLSSRDTDDRHNYEDANLGSKLQCTSGCSRKILTKLRVVGGARHVYCKSRTCKFLQFELAGAGAHMACTQWRTSTNARLIVSSPILIAVTATYGGRRKVDMKSQGKSAWWSCAILNASASAGKHEAPFRHCFAAVLSPT